MKRPALPLLAARPALADPTIPFTPTDRLDRATAPRVTALGRNGAVDYRRVTQ
ncbi:hypothetical protein [uncultured Tateyamaria sp.]|uniref:hypothetical protein n=1 Tax=uncultured Tateyamaria sp. TaxID=455651 RepID=UPI0026137E48|nr:hypothetical protein [uncultured Tateyamaria sp.]